MNVIQAIKTKRAVRQYSPEAVPEPVIREILNAGRLAQSSKNSQPWTFLVLQDKERLLALSKCHPWAGHVADSAFTVVLVTTSAWPFDIGQAAANMQLAAWELGVGSGLVYLSDQAAARALLQVPENQHAEMAIAFGYPKSPEKRPANPAGRKPLDQVVRWEYWESK
jgi:nitroreductase